jgi:tight adherence protein B
MNISPQFIPLVIALGAMAVVILVGLAFSGGGQNAKEIEKRLKRGHEEMAAHMTRKRGRRGSLLREEEATGIEALLRKMLPNPQKLRARLERTGKTISIGEFMLYNLGSVLAIAIALRLFAGMGPLICVSTGTLIGILLPNKVIKIMGNRRVNKFMKEFPNAIDMIVRGLRSGLPFIESVNAVGKEFPDPIGIEFRRISDSVKLGSSVESAMWDVSERIDAAEFKFLIVAMTIQRETGGNLGETLANLSDLLRKRKALKLKIRALSSEARASAYIIGSLPFLMLLIINVVNHDYVKVLWTDPRGVNISIGGGLLMLFGFYVMHQMINFEV